MENIVRDQIYKRGLMLGVSIPLSQADALLKKMQADAKKSPKKEIWDILLEGYESGVQKQKERQQKRQQELTKAKGRGRGKSRGRSR